MSDIEGLKREGFWYVASPYSHPLASVREQRAFEANTYTGKLLAAGVHVYSPIWATHRAGVLHELPKDHLFWLAFNKAFIDPAVGILVADISGWKDSKGCVQEIEYAKSQGKPVILVSRNLDLREIEGVTQ